MDDEEELRAFREGLDEIEDRLTAHSLITASGSLLRTWRREARLESITGRRPDGLEITAYADDTVTARIVDADDPEMDVTAAVDEHERRVREQDGEELSDG